ncbi:hypothetical protein DM02DRAFT_694254, partial [Periconia macrospinosa]
ITYLAALKQASTQLSPLHHHSSRHFHISNPYSSRPTIFTMPAYSTFFVPISDPFEALVSMTGLIEELQELTKSVTKGTVDRATAQNISANLRKSLGHIDALVSIAKTQEKEKKKKELLFDEERAAMAARMKDMEAKMDEERTATATRIKDVELKMEEERAAMTTQIDEIQSKHDNELAALKKHLSDSQNELLSHKVTLYNTKTELAEAHKQAQRKPIYSIPPHLRKPTDAAAAHHTETKKKLEALQITHDSTLKKLDAAEATILTKEAELAAAKSASTTKQQELETFRRYHASFNEAFSAQLYGADTQIRELSVQKHLVEHMLQQEQQKAAGFLLQLDDTKRALANATEACEGTPACTSCVQHLRAALRVSQAHEAEAGRRFDAMWVAQLRATESLAAAKAGMVVSPVVEEERKEEREGEEVEVEADSLSSSSLSSEEESSSDDDSEFEIITGC